MAQRPKTRAAGTVKRSGKAKPAKAHRAPAKAADVVERPAKVKTTTKAAASKPTKLKAAQATSTKAAAKKSTAKKTAVKKTKAPTAVAKAARGKTAKSATKKVRAAPVAATTKRNPAKPTTKTKTVEKAAKPIATGHKAPAVRKPRKADPALAPIEPPYLAAELGQPVDYEGEPIGAGSASVRTDKELQDYTLQLWRQMQSGGVVNRYMRAIERAGLTIDEVWTAGVVETRSTSSTADEMRRYREKLLFRANLLEAILSETVADLHRLEGIEPGDAEKTDKTPEQATPPETSNDAASAPSATA